MTNTTDVVVDDEMIDPVTGEIIDQKELAERLLAQAKEQGVSLTGPGGLLSQLTKSVLETALNAELTEHLGHEHGGAPIGENMRNGTRVKTVLTEISPVEIEVPRDRDGSFEPVTVPKRKRRLDGVDQIVLSLTARGLTTGEIAAHFDEVYVTLFTEPATSRRNRRRRGQRATRWKPLASMIAAARGDARNSSIRVAAGDSAAAAATPPANTVSIAQSSGSTPTMRTPGSPVSSASCWNPRSTSPTASARATGMPGRACTSRPPSSSAMPHSSIRRTRAVPLGPVE